MSSRKLLVFLILAALMTLITAVPRLAGADEAVEAARALFARGQKSFEAGRFLEAAADFEAAYKLTPRADLLYDAGHAYDKAGNAARAVEMYEAYLRAGEALPVETRIRQRLDELRPLVAYVLIRANRDGARVTIDGQDRGTTPMVAGVPLSSGLHRIEVRLDNMVFRTEQEFAIGLTHTVTAELHPSPTTEPEERPGKRFAAVLGFGGIIGVLASNYPPSQAHLHAGFDYRFLDRRSVALDVSFRLPIELGQGWTNTALLPGLRVVLYLSRKYGLELVPSLDVGLSILHVNKVAAPKITAAPCTPAVEACTLPALRVHPSLNFVYHFLPDWELRFELFGVTADITSPVPDPRVSFGVSAAWRFY